MKKYLGYLLLLFILVPTTKINASTLQGQNFTSNKVVTEYNTTTKELYAYGYNNYSNLGTNNNTNVTQENKIKLNSLIANKEIIDYAFLDTTTYLLTSDGSLYASGYNYGQGNILSKTFKKIYLVKPSKYKIASIHVTSNTLGNAYKGLDKNVKGVYSLTVQTNSNTNYYTFNNKNTSEQYAMTLNWIEKFYRNDYYKNKKYYFVYVDKIMKDRNIEIITNGSNAIIQKLIIYKEDNVYVSYYYSNNKLYRTVVYTKSQDTINKFKDGVLYQKEIYKYTSSKTINYGRKTVVKDIYSYSKGNIYLKKNYKLENNKLKIKSIKKYYRNSKGELKSNKNGKAKTYITYYKNNKAYVTYRYQYNAKGQMINKTKVKLIKNLK